MCTTWSAVLNSVITQRFTNQVLLGVNYFNQIFFDENHNINPIAFGFNTGAARSRNSLRRARESKITGFDNLQNATPPSGRNDVTGQVTDSASLVFGKHELRFSGEYRRGYVNEFYHRKTPRQLLVSWDAGAVGVRYSDGRQPNGL